jgi:hypothetical protein
MKTNISQQSKSCLLHQATVSDQPTFSFLLVTDHWRNALEDLKRIKSELVKMLLAFEIITLCQSVPILTYHNNDIAVADTHPS